MSREPQKAGEQIPQRLPLKTCVGIVLINRAGQIWIGRRHHVWLSPAERTVWQMPQGGVEDGEDLESAARRELYEETGVRSVELLAMSGCWHTYQLPDALLGVALKGRYGGQRQRWFAMRFVGPDAEIDISGVTHKRPEFDAWRWAEAWEIPALAVDFKRPIYEAVLSEFVGLVGRPLAAVQDGAPKS